ncbi:MAG: glycosyltransferase family 2 protein, partial [Bacteroidetes bacterium]|nr:glycosyltransferase family 2 protein [Bacteroidota bacterium]
RFLRNRIMMYQGINQETNREYDLPLRKNIARYYRMMLDARQFSRSYFRRATLALYYLYLRRPAMEEIREVCRDYIVPKWVVNVYSFFALLPHRFRGSL